MMKQDEDKTAALIFANFGKYEAVLQVILREEENNG